MKDERYAFIQDVKDKKNTARSARNKRTHNGRSGSVKLPSDYMTKKELKSMSGEVKSYRLNAPMTWKEFKAMPEDIQYNYIKLLKEKYGVINTAIGGMMGVCHDLVTKHMRSNGYDITSIPHGKFDKEGWIAFVNGISEPKKEPVKITGEAAQIIEKTADEKETVLPCTGELHFVGEAEAILDSVKHIIGCGKKRISISWEEV